MNGFLQPRNTAGNLSVLLSMKKGPGPNDRTPHEPFSININQTVYFSSAKYLMVRTIWLV